VPDETDRAITSAVAATEGLTATQRLLIDAVRKSMTGLPAVLEGEPIGSTARPTAAMTG
jgi:hypothetical protein